MSLLKHTDLPFNQQNAFSITMRALQLWRNSAIRTNLISIFQHISASIKNILSLKGRLGTTL